MADSTVHDIQRAMNEARDTLIQALRTGKMSPQNVINVATRVSDHVSSCQFPPMNKETDSDIKESQYRRYSKANTIIVRLFEVGRNSLGRIGPVGYASGAEDALTHKTHRKQTPKQLVRLPNVLYDSDDEQPYSNTTKRKRKQEEETLISGIAMGMISDFFGNQEDCVDSVTADILEACELKEDSSEIVFGLVQKAHTKWSNIVDETFAKEIELNDSFEDWDVLAKKIKELKKKKPKKKKRKKK